MSEPTLGAGLPDQASETTENAEDAQTRDIPETTPENRLTWLLMGNRAGDNSQVLGLGEALGWPLVEKHFEFPPYEKVVNLPWGAHLMGIVRSRSTPLEAPWPDVVISAGRKNEPVARYVR